MSTAERESQEQSSSVLESDQEKEQTSVINVESDRENAITNVPDLGKAPDGGLRAWFVAIGACCIFFSTRLLSVLLEGSCCIFFNHFAC